MKCITISTQQRNNWHGKSSTRGEANHQRGQTMETQEILKRIAYLEFVNDQLATELQDLDDLLRKAGFPNGVESVREVACEILEERMFDPNENDYLI